MCRWEQLIRFTLVEAVGTDVLASEASGIETIADPSLPNFSLDIFQELFCTEDLDSSDNNRGFMPKYCSYGSVVSKVRSYGQFVL